jgi:hemolysin D
MLMPDSEDRPLLRAGGEAGEALRRSVSTFESSTAEVLASRSPGRNRTVLYGLAGFLACAVLFISVFQLDRIVRAPGKIVPLQGSLFVQPLDKAIVRSIDVRVGDFVKKNQVLATLDPTFAAADLTALQQKVASLEPEIRRIEAEESGRRFVAKDNSTYEALQESTYLHRKGEYTSTVEAQDEKIRSDEANIARLLHEAEEYNKRAVIASDVEDRWNQLAGKGYVSHMTVLTSTSSRIELERLRDEARDSLASTEHDLASLKAERTSSIQKWHDDNLATLVTSRNDLDAAQQDLAKAERTRSLINLVAPQDAFVTKVADLSAVGAVANAGAPLFTLVPADSPLEADIQIASKDAGFPRVGDKVNLKFDAYEFLEHGVAEGRIETISQNSFTTNPDGTPAASPYFDARVKVTALHMRDVPQGFRLTPGMTLQADIVVGRRTILWYILGGALRSGSEAMHEP